MTVTQNLIAGSLIAVGIASAGLAVKGGIDNFVERDRVVTVKGLAEREVAADYVIWPVSFRVMGNDLMALYTEANRQSAVIEDYLVKQGIAKEDIAKGTPRVTDLHENLYTNKVPADRYRLEMEVSVTSRNVPAVLKAMVNQTELIAQKIIFQQSYRTEFSFTGLNAIKPEMIQEATKNARTAAQKFADDSESKLGKIRRANQGQFSITNRDNNTPHIKKVRIVTTVEYYLKD